MAIYISVVRNLASHEIAVLMMHVVYSANPKGISMAVSEAQMLFIGGNETMRLPISTRMEMV